MLFHEAFDLFSLSRSAIVSYKEVSFRLGHISCAEVPEANSVTGPPAQRVLWAPGRDHLLGQGARKAALEPPLRYFGGGRGGGAFRRLRLGIRGHGIALHPGGLGSSRPSRSKGRESGAGCAAAPGDDANRCAELSGRGEEGLERGGGLGTARLPRRGASSSYWEHRGHCGESRVRSDGGPVGGCEIRPATTGDADPRPTGHRQDHSCRLCGHGLEVARGPHTLCCRLQRCGGQSAQEPCKVGGSRLIVSPRRNRRSRR